MTDKTSTQITFPPTYYKVHSSKGKVAKVCALTSICVTIIISAAVCLGLYFTRDDFHRHQEFNLNMKNQQQELPMKITLNTEENLEYVKLPKLEGYNEMMILRDYNQGLMAMKDLTSAGDCLIGEFNGKPEDIKEIHRTLTNNKNVEIKTDKEVTLLSLQDPIHPEVLAFAAGKAIAKFCNGSSYWIVTKGFSRKKRLSPVSLINPATQVAPGSLMTPMMSPGIPATQVVVNPVPLSQGLVNANGQQPLNLNNFLQNLQATNTQIPVNGPQNINPQIPVNSPQNSQATFTPVVLNPANNNALNIAGSAPLTFGSFNSPLVAAALNPSQVSSPSVIPANPTPILPAITGAPSQTLMPTNTAAVLPVTPGIQTPGTGQTVAQPTNSLCDNKCVTAMGTGSFSIAQLYYFCNIVCVPKQFANTG